MATRDELTRLDVAALAPLLRAKELSPVELTEAYLGRIEALDRKINSYITVTAGLAREQAKAAEREIAAGNWRGPFHGIPIGLKDLCYTKGIRTTAASKILVDFKPEFDSTVWVKLREAGAILLGKLNLHEFAYAFWSVSPHFGEVHNPYDLERITGGSSGGSGAAIVAGLAAATIGTDTGGSIRVPAALCGCVGLKPTWSRVSRHGVVPLAYTLDHVGPITRTVRDAALMLNVIAGHDPNDGTSSREPVPDYASAISQGDLKGVRVGAIRELTRGIAAESADSFAGALKQLAAMGAEVVEVSVPSFDAIPTAVGIINFAEALDYHEKWLRERPQDYGADVRAVLELGLGVSGMAYVRAQRSRARALGETLDHLDKCAVLVAPGSLMAAPRIDQIKQQMARGDAPGFEFLRITGPFDATGQPVITVPVGLTPGGLPLGMQVAGKPFDEAGIIRVASAFEHARGPIPPPRL